MTGTLVFQALTTVLQTLIVFACVAEARFPGGALWMAITVVAAALISVFITSLSAGVPVLRHRGRPVVARVGAARRALQPGRLGRGRVPPIVIRLIRIEGVVGV